MQDEVRQASPNQVRFCCLSVLTFLVNLLIDIDVLQHTVLDATLCDITKGAGA